MFGNNYVNPWAYGNPQGNPYSAPTPNYYSQMNTQMQAQQGIPMQGVKLVTEDEAKAFIVTPNSRVLLMDKDNSIFYIKSADSLGQSTLERYEFKKIENNSQESKSVEKDNVNLSDYVKKDDLNGLITQDVFNEQIKTIETKLSVKIDELKRSINLKKYLEGEIENA